MPTKSKVFKIISVLMAMVFISMLFTGCVRNKDGKLLFNNDSYSLVYQYNGVNYFNLNIDEDWSIISVGLNGMTYLSPDGEIIFKAGRETCLYVKDGCTSPSYDNLSYDSMEIYFVRGEDVEYKGFFASEYVITVTKRFDSTTFDSFVHKDNFCKQGSNRVLFHVEMHSDKNFLGVFKFLSRKENYIYRQILKTLATWLLTNLPIGYALWSHPKTNLI